MNPTRLVCLVLTHRYVKVHFPDSDAPGEYLLRCSRCGHERDLPPRDPNSPGTYAWDV